MPHHGKEPATRLSRQLSSCISVTDEASLPAGNHTNLETSVTGLFDSRLLLVTA